MSKFTVEFASQLKEVIVGRLSGNDFQEWLAANAARTDLSNEELLNADLVHGLFTQYKNGRITSHERLIDQLNIFHGQLVVDMKVPETPKSVQKAIEKDLKELKERDEEE